MAAYAALVSLMQVIHDVEHHPYPPVSLDTYLVESITQHVTFFQEFLQAYSPPVADNDEEEAAADPLEMSIARAAYAAEDAIESHIVDAIQQLSSNVCSKIIWLLNCFRAPKEKNLRRAIKEMDSIKKVVEVKVNTEKKMMVSVVVRDQVPMTNVLASIAPSETMVGLDDILLEIMEKLTGGPPVFKVIPIVGMGGIGKTFLAKNIYAQPFIKEHFDICAWATISQQYNMGETLCEVLSQATNREKVQLSGKSVDVLGSELHKYLFGRRFLIVMDDMWSIDAWDTIQRFFPNNENGSRVLVTTRLSQLCSQLNNDYNLHMSFLDEPSSWDLFSKTVFGDKSCPLELKKLGEKIVQNCRGLPLSITVVGGLLKKLDGTRGSWESIRDNLTSVVNMENDKHCFRLLKMSYNHLPVYLKPCFLYMGVFEEDDEIHVSTLVKLWVSEGFLKPTNGESLETTARGFFQDLIDRNLILSSNLRSTGSIKYCKIHDLLRDMCLKEAQKEGFYHVIGQCDPPLQCTNTQRRIVIPRNNSTEKVRDELRSMSHARSVICEYDMLPPCRNMRWLRTLHAYTENYGHANSLACRYVNLRHLAIFNDDGTSPFLPSASVLWNLRTLIVSCSQDPYLLVDFWKMPQFRHIKFVGGNLSLPDPPNCDARDGDAVVIMENLHTLKGVMNFKCSEGVVKRIPNIKKLKLLYHIYLLEYHDQDKYRADNVKSLCRLESLSIVVRGLFDQITHKLTFPPSLKKLSLQISCTFSLDCGFLEVISSLPLLEKLRINGGRFWRGEWNLVEGQFPCLKHLELRLCWGLKRWTAAEEGSDILPRLEHIGLFQLKQLEKIPCELGKIDTLKRIQMVNCREELEKSAKEMVDEQVELQGVEQISLYIRGPRMRFVSEPRLVPIIHEIKSW